jgi:argininosuccinate lyase
LEAAADARKSDGGTAPSRVREQVAYWKENLK